MASFLLGPTLLAKAGSGCTGVTPTGASRPIVLSQLREVEGVALHDLGVWKLGGESIEPAVFQVDEKNQRDEYVLPYGKPFTKHDGNGRVDLRDELVVSSSDLVGDADGPKFLKLWKKKVSKLKESNFLKLWQVSVCIPEQKISGLLFLSAGKPFAFKQGRPKPKVVYNKVDQTILTNTYRYEFAKDKPLLLGKVSLRSKKGYEPIISSSQMRIPIKSSWYLPNTTLSANSFVSEVESWKQGPLRSIVAVGVKYERLFSLVQLHMFSEWIFYDSHFQVPQTVVFPLNFKKYLKPGSGIAYSIRLIDPKSWAWSANIPRVTPHSARRRVEHAKSNKLPERFVAKAVNSARGWTIKARLRLDPDRLKGNPSPFLLVGPDFLERQNVKNWPWIKKIPGDFGVFQDFSQMQGGSYDFGLDLSLGNSAKLKIPDLRTAQTKWKALF